MKFTDHELQVMLDTDFLLTKRQVIEKVKKLFIQTRSKLQGHLDNSVFDFPDEVKTSKGKISRGENYQQLPYLVLDHPAHFSKDGILAFRTMFWWGNFFSFTWHLQGQYWNLFRKKIHNSIYLLPTDAYICINENPWEYHYGADNYQRVSEINPSQIRGMPFFKISKKMELAKWTNVPEEASQFFLIFSNLLLH